MVSFSSQILLVFKNSSIFPHSPYQMVKHSAVYPCVHTYIYVFVMYAYACLCLCVCSAIWLFITSRAYTQCTKKAATCK